MSTVSLYRQFLRAAKSFTDYNFQSYAIRRVREQFRDHKALVGSELEAVLKRATEEQLPQLVRMG
eukprot:CAMPEP_0195520028 /NCGR_PEP_ID=MMETSP0794_2-20130614/15962_1 /TAXON_ID=515487 /ORGANISM="Stephanopyxis turris, Strain CCMP 815" /LENGTH=64 /DNA_ID=CAMNT_0040649297 /DNA_START=72 /DNA_END=262 /DNA_ORIENTATION=+